MTKLLRDSELQIEREVLCDEMREDRVSRYWAHQQWASSAIGFQTVGCFRSCPHPNCTLNF